ncbi:hypothetical protein LSH36_280g01055 [Paralvinella palmiformis]|uniref:Uncharacterized protein n=1 Tax=Paralvinella palmiformis TaxID=53620 RepID=A0AAD9N3T0_9ANNE|nr:hypothetical protein LSH36_280g01055 [Paralvinella palmiformis]
MELLYKKCKHWNYLLTLSGQMYPLKTNLDIIRILKSLNGSNAVEGSIKEAERVKGRWYTQPPPPLNITIVKGGCHFAVTRSFVRYVLYDVRALLFRNWVRSIQYPDEHYFQTLSHNAHLEVPGAYTGTL